MPAAQPDATTEQPASSDSPKVSEQLVSALEGELSATAGNNVSGEFSQIGEPSARFSQIQSPSGQFSQIGEPSARFSQIQSPSGEFSQTTRSSKR